MIDCLSSLVNALGTVLPTHYEMQLTSKTAVPCISYMELNNQATETGDTLGYRRLQYQVKVWGRNNAELQDYTYQVDDVLRPLGWKRISTNELQDRQGMMIQKILTFEATGLEEF